VGSVEFVRAYCKHVGITLPESFSYGLYEDQLKEYLKRPVRRGTYNEALQTDFVKPIETKKFTGVQKIAWNLKEMDSFLTKYLYGFHLSYHLSQNSVSMLRIS
jgi:hypothetical protein